jgi:hypothetical protein
MSPNLFFPFLLCAMSFAFCMKPATSDVNFVFCDYNKSIDLKTRMQNPIFKNTLKIEVRSFENYNNYRPNCPKDMPTKACEAYKAREFAKQYAAFWESVFLNMNQIDSLSEIMLFKKNPYPSDFTETQIDSIVTEANISAACFNPHHAIIFYDKNEKPLLRWNICFGCGNFEIDASPVYANEIYKLYVCNRQLDALKIFFKNIGIKKEL